MMSFGKGGNMVLSDRDIWTYLKEEKIVLRPAPDLKESLGSCSLDLRLGEVAKKVDSHLVKKKTQKKTVTLSPGEFLLATTLEYMELPDTLCGMLHGRSSLGRKGIMVHSTAPLIDAGFRGKIVLELFNSGNEPVTLEIHERICGLTFHQLSSPAEVPYYKKKDAKYLGQTKPKL